MVSKVVQSLANGVKFGTKEHFLTPVNDFLDQFSNPLNKYLKSLATAPTPLNIVSITIPAAMIEEAIVRLSSIFEDNLTKIEEILGEGVMTEVSCHLLSLHALLSFGLMNLALCNGSKLPIQCPTI